MKEITATLGSMPTLEASLAGATVSYDPGTVIRHSDVTERSFPNQHPISAITGLSEALGNIITNDTLKVAVEDTVKVILESGELKGEKGEKGDIGETGPKGDTGAQGEKGDTGERGPQGEKGDIGPKGDTGPRGEKGEQGVQGEHGPQGEKGEDGTGVRILGSYSSVEELRSAHPSGEIGDAYMIEGSLYVWSASENSWINVGSIKGEDGYTPVKGKDYYTDSDKAEIVSQLLSALPTWSGGEF